MTVELEALAEARMEADRLNMARRPDAAVWRSKHRQQDRWERRLADAVERWLLQVRPRVDVAKLAKIAQDAQGQAKKAAPTPAELAVQARAAAQDAVGALGRELAATYAVDAAALELAAEAAAQQLAGLIEHGEAFEDAMQQVAADVFAAVSTVAHVPREAFDRAWASAREAIRARLADPLRRVAAERVRESFEEQLGGGEDHQRGGMQVYTSMAEDASEEAGQHVLDSLGLDRTFRWTGQRDLVRDQFAVRGSKVLQHAVGSHGAELARIIAEATDPASPRSSQEVAREIRRRWDELTRSQAERIARTETAAVWETANWNVMRLNGVRRVDWIVARGPSVGPPTSGPVCPLCLRLAAESPHDIRAVELPPKHPNCRCHLVPARTESLLPPAETFTGTNPPLPLREAPSP